MTCMNFFAILFCEIKYYLHFWINHVKQLKMLLFQHYLQCFVSSEDCYYYYYCSDWAKVGWKVPAVRPFTRRSSRPPLSGHCCRLNGIMCIRKVSESELKITFTSGWLPLPHVNPDWPASMHSLLPQPWLELFPPQALCVHLWRIDFTSPIFLHTSFLFVTFLRMCA